VHCSPNCVVLRAAWCCLWGCISLFRCCGIPPQSDSIVCWRSVKPLKVSDAFGTTRGWPHFFADGAFLCHSSVWFRLFNEPDRLAALLSIGAISRGPELHDAHGALPVGPCPANDRLEDGEVTGGEHAPCGLEWLHALLRVLMPLLGQSLMMALCIPVTRSVECCLMFCWQC